MTIRTPPVDDLSVDALRQLLRRCVVPLAVGIAVSVVVGSLVGWGVQHGFGTAIDGIDQRIVRGLVDRRTDRLDVLARAAEAWTAPITVAVVWTASVALLAWRTRSWLLSVFIVFVVGGEKLSYLLTTVIVARPRPPVEAIGAGFSTSSFPSGHVGAAVALYGSLAVVAAWCGPLRLRRTATAALVACAVAAVTALVAASRLYEGQHVPTDALWGAVLALGWLTAGWLVVLRPGGEPASAATQRVDEPAGIGGVRDDRPASG